MRKATNKLLKDTNTINDADIISYEAYSTGLNLSIIGKKNTGVHENDDTKDIDISALYSESTGTPDSFINMLRVPARNVFQSLIDKNDLLVEQNQELKARLSMSFSKYHQRIKEMQARIDELRDCLVSNSYKKQVIRIAKLASLVFCGALLFILFIPEVQGVIAILTIAVVISIMCLIIGSKLDDNRNM